MANSQTEPVIYRRAQFVAALPASSLYTASHAWLSPNPGGIWRVGLTKFALRMLGELVDHGFAVEPGAVVTEGQIIGWIEGFKAISDLYCVIAGQFQRGNPALQEQIAHLSRDPHGAGWVYEVQGTPGPRCLDVQAYCDLLDKTIDRLMARQNDADPTPGFMA